jgi:hypothetical protein
MVALVEQMLATKPQLAAAQSDADKDFYGNKCAALDRQIDGLVYELYGLTDEEIGMVENSLDAKKQVAAPPPENPFAKAEREMKVVKQEEVL